MIEEGPWLFHGGRALVPVLQPRTAFGVGDEKYRLHAVYATHERKFAIPFALPIMPDADGQLAWSMSLENGEPVVRIRNGTLDLARVGYLYRVPRELFEPIDERQWVSLTAVTPLDYEIVRPEDFLSWIVPKRVGDGGRCQRAV